MILILEKSLSPGGLLATSLVLPPGDKTYSEVDIAIEIASAITKGSIKDAQLLVRLHPLADESDYAPLINMKHVKIQIR